jgi:hypothetical protein
LLAVSFSHYFKAADDKFHLKQRVISLELFLNSGEYIDLSIDADLVALVIDYHPENVSQFQYKHTLFDEDLADFYEATFEKLVIVDEIAGKHKLWLESSPDRM